MTLFALKKISARDAGVYVVAQVAGAIVAALIVQYVLQNEGDFRYGAPGFAGLNGKVFPAFLAEAIGTFALVWAIVSTAVYGKGNAANWAPWVIGATLGFAVVALGQLSGGSFNPARALGPAIVGGLGTGGGKWVLVYALGPVVGGLLAGLTCRGLVGERSGG